MSGIRIGRYSLNEHRQKLLERVPSTGDEFAILRSKHEDVLFHGDSMGCRFTGDLENGLKSHKYKLVGHSHPGEDEPEPSLQDRAFLRKIGQQRSTVISARTGRVTNYTDDFYSTGGDF